MDIEFNNLKELKTRITPALNTKLKELKSKNYNTIETEEIWNFLINTKWKKANNLTLYDIINDILNSENEDIEEYVKRRKENDKN